MRFPFTPDQIPRGQTQVFERTVSPGSSLEVSMAAVIMDFHFSDSVTGKARIHFIDLYNRNPTSADQTVNVKEAWMLFGRRTDFLQEVDGSRFMFFSEKRRNLNVSRNAIWKATDLFQLHLTGSKIFSCSSAQTSVPIFTSAVRYPRAIRTFFGIRMRWRAITD